LADGSWHPEGDAVSGREPEITVLGCRYCGNVPVEMAGAQRVQYAPTVKVLTVPCTGTIAVLQLLKALEQGADGVLVVACPEGNCHHLTGNQRAAKRVAQARAVLREAGLEPDRLRLASLGIGQARAFAAIVGEMTERIRALGTETPRAVDAPAQG
jgi:coenzyme F420-reducing hydrogenase delta subunit